MYPEQVEIIDVSMRDGLQNEIITLPTQEKLEVIRALVACGIRRLEVGSFVNPKLVPQLADTDILFESLSQESGIAYAALVANQSGLNRALHCRVRYLAFFTAASEAFCLKNINCSISQSMQRFEALIAEARDRYPVNIRGYLSCAWDCPFNGPVEIEKAVASARQLRAIGCDEIVLADTTGKADPIKVELLLKACLNDIDKECIAVHFHNNYGLALANIVVALQLGISKFDSSLAGLGGCPSSPFAGGNVASEDLLFMLDSMAIETNVDLALLAATGRDLANFLSRPNMALTTQTRA